MSSDTPDFAAGAVPRARGGRPPREPRSFPLLPVVLALGLVVLGVDVAIWFVGQGRLDQALKETIAEAREFREKAEAEAAAAKPKKGSKKAKAPTPPSGDGEVSLAALTSENEALARELEGFRPSGIYIVIDTANNRLYMKKDNETLLDAVCSTGSYSRLDAPDGRSWFFHTPRGKFRILGKKQNPVWVKPDWAFVEEAEPIPGATHPDRYEPYVMGDYALSFGNGYYIHGTLYRRLLGQSVTHGCVRLGDEELEQVYRTAPTGTPIFIY